jgi:hypothetical protein
MYQPIDPIIHAHPVGGWFIPTGRAPNRPAAGPP